ncbi:Uncharacterised protein [Legionella lansingensis]|nr:Uncharacterised protein [Legionella lansingensis]
MEPICNCIVLILSKNLRLIGNIHVRNALESSEGGASCITHLGPS